MTYAPAPAPPPPGRHSAVAAAAMLAVMALQILSRLTDAAWPDWLSWAAMAVIVGLARHQIGRRELYLLGMCALTGLAVLALHPDPWRVIAAALTQGAFLMAFILQLGLLYEAAATSRSTAEFGPYLTGQPPGRRYLSLYTGTGVLAVLFNAGILSFLVPLVQGGRMRKTGADPGADLTQRRQINALMRGFAWCVTFSPTALAPLLMADLVPEIDRLVWMAYGLCVFAVVLALGLLEDRSGLDPTRPPVPMPVPTRAALGLAGASAALLVIAFAAMWLAGEGLAFGLMIACPAMLVGWTIVQNLGQSAPLPATAARLTEIVRDLPAATSIAIALASAGFVGLSIAALLPADSLAQALDPGAMPDIVVLFLVPLVLALVSLTGLTPIMMSVILGNLLAGMTAPPVDLTLLAFAISCGWALAMTFSPLSTLALLISRISTITSFTLTWRWNLGFSALTYLSLLPVMAVIYWLHTAVLGM